jgi:hypothetical protein
MVEYVEVDSNRLGEGWRCVLDFGAALIEAKAGCKSGLALPNLVGVIVP